MSKISAIICAYNEEKTIKEVVTTVCEYFFDEVIVVNDGSTDGTANILSELHFLPSLKYIALPENKGKGHAMVTGIEHATGEIIVFIDADLSNLKEGHFEQLISPVFSNEAQGKRVKYVMLEGLKHPSKFDKAGSKSRAIKEFVLEGHQIALALFNNFNSVTKIVNNQINKF